MTVFRGLLLFLTTAIAIMTVGAVMDGGLDFMSPFLGPVGDMSWQGQINVDFLSYLVLSGVWMAWRSGFSGRGIALGLFGPLLGMAFFAPYLFVLVGQSGGDPRKLLLGVRALPS